MSKKEDNYGSAYLYAEDLLHGGEFRTVTVEISEYIPANTLRAANNKIIDKPSVKFVGKQKILVLCKTNAAMIHYCTGELPDRWVGKTITLQPRIIEAFGDSVVAIRVIPPPGVKVRRSVLKRLGEKAVWTAGEGTPPPAKPKQEAPAEQPPEDGSSPSNLYAVLKAKIAKANNPAALQAVRGAVQEASDQGALDVEQRRTLDAQIDKRQEQLDAKAVGAASA